MSLIEDIEKLVAKVPFGKVFLTLSNDQGNTRSMHASYLASIGKYKNNVDARAAIEEVIQQIETEKKHGGAITLTLVPQDGVISQITVNNTDRMTFQY